MMTLAQAQEKLDKAIEKHEKKYGTITKKEKGIEKKIAELLKKYNYTYEGKKYCDELESLGYSKDDAWHMYWIICDIDSYYDDIERLHKEIKELDEVIAKHESNLKKVQAAEDKKAKYPDCLIELQENIVEKWDAYDIEEREKAEAGLERIREEYADVKNFSRYDAKKLYETNLALYERFQEYRKLYERYSECRYLGMTDAEIHNANVRDAEALIRNLIIRVENGIGEITSYDYVGIARNSYGCALTGYFVGTHGKCRIESILAGGYNIQRLHVRILTHFYDLV